MKIKFWGFIHSINLMGMHQNPNMGGISVSDADNSYQKEIGVCLLLYKIRKFFYLFIYYPKKKDEIKSSLFN